MKTALWLFTTVNNHKNYFSMEMIHKNIMKVVNEKSSEEEMLHLRPFKSKKCVYKSHNNKNIFTTEETDIKLILLARFCVKIILSTNIKKCFFQINYWRWVLLLISSSEFPYSLSLASECWEGKNQLSINGEESSRVELSVQCSHFKSSWNV